MGFEIVREPAKASIEHQVASLWCWRAKLSRGSPRGANLQRAGLDKTMLQWASLQRLQ